MARLSSTLTVWRDRTQRFQNSLSLKPIQPSEQSAAAIESTESRDETIGQAIRMSEGVVIDGTLDEWPLLYPMLPQNYDSPADSPTVLYSQWTDDNFFIAAVINRDAEPPPTHRKIQWGRGIASVY